MTETRLQLCGKLVVRADGKRVEGDLPGRQGRLLLVFLSLNRQRPVSRDELIEALWPEGAPSAPEMALSALLSKLRKLLPQGWVEGRSAVRLVLPADASVDIDHARDAVHRAEAYVGRASREGWNSDAFMAASITRRPLLPGEDAPWIEDARRELEDIHVRARECNVRMLLDIGPSEVSNATRIAGQVVERAPYRESAHRLLMEALAAEDNTAEALRAYERLRQLLRDELGTVPSPATQDLHTRLLQASSSSTGSAARGAQP